MINDNKIFDIVKSKINLADFLETEIGCKLNWYANGTYAGTICPLPNHKDAKPSFRMKLTDGVWVYNCFGCGAKGTIIDFCMNYYNMAKSIDAVKYLCQKYNIKMDENFNSDHILISKKRTEEHKRIEYMNLVQSNQCRMLLKNNYEKNNKWVSKMYKRMNIAVDNDDVVEMEAIGMEISRRAI